MFLSIVIPVYNSQKYIKESLSSCFQQEALDEPFEVVLIDDGSTDNSICIIEEFLSKNQKSKIKTKIISQINQGPGGARNNGVQNSEGEYIWFVDSDDTIKQDSLSIIYNEIKKHKEKPDIILTNYSGHLQGDIISGKDLLLEGNYSTAPHFYICKRVFLIENGLSFIPKIFYEDSELIPRMLYHASIMLCIRKPLYNITINEHSITRSKTNKIKCLSHLYVAKRLVRFANTIQANELRNSIKGIAAYMFNSFIDEALYLAKDDRYYIELIKKNKRHFKNCFHGGEIAHKIEALFSLLPNNLFIFFFKLFKKSKKSKHPIFR